MAYGRLELRAVDAASMDLSDPFRSALLLTKIFSCDLSADDTFTAGIGGTTLDLGHLCDGSSSNQVCILNLDGTNFVTVTWDDFDNAGNTGRVGEGGLLVLSDVDGGTALTLTADTADCTVRVFVLSEA